MEKKFKDRKGTGTSDQVGYKASALPSELYIHALSWWRSLYITFSLLGAPVKSISTLLYILSNQRLCPLLFSIACNFPVSFSFCLFTIPFNKYYIYFQQNRDLPTPWLGLLMPIIVGLSLHNRRYKNMKSLQTHSLGLDNIMHRYVNTIS